MRYLLIVNPTSGGRHHSGQLEKVLRFFRRHGDEVVLYQTAGPGDATRVARDGVRQGFDAIIGAGGDGTIHEVVGGLVGTNTPLGILPWGTGNVFAREMGLPRRVKALCRTIRQGRTSVLDLGLADGRPFLLMASAGFDAYTLGQMSSKKTKRLWGLWAYAWSGLVSLARYHHPKIEVRLDDGTVDRGSFVLVSNTRLYGAFFVVHPRANPTDGHLDVFVFRNSGRWAFLGMVFHLLARRAFAPRSRRPAPFLKRHGVHSTTGLDLIPSHGRPFQLDGEHLAAGVARIEIATRALRVILPKKAWKRLKSSS